MSSTRRQCCAISMWESILDSNGRSTVRALFGGLCFVVHGQEKLRKLVESLQNGLHRSLLTNGALPRLPGYAAFSLLPCGAYDSIRKLRSRDSETRHFSSAQPQLIRKFTLQKLHRATMEVTCQASNIRANPISDIYTTDPTRIAVEFRSRLIEHANGLVLLIRHGSSWY